MKVQATSPTVDRVVRGQLCSGCGLCAGVSGGAIQMRTVAPGYRRPDQRGGITAEVEAKIAASCPGAVVESWAAGGHPAWGPARQVATGFVTDPGVRFKASSGGVVSGLLLYALRTGLIDRAVHVLADPANPTGNLVVCSRTAEDIVAGAGSRYSSSSPLADIDRLLGDGGAIGFVGKPCDVSALRRLAHRDPRVNAHVPLMLSFFCGGIPSDAGARRILAAMDVAPEELAAFRYRGEGWPGDATAVTHGGRVAKMSYAESWGDHLSHEVQFRCKICPDAVGGVADIVCGDAWYGDEGGYPVFDEQEGRSLIVSRSAAGEALLSAAVAAGDLSVEPLEISEIDRMQPAQLRRKRLVKARLAALRVTLQPTPDMRGTLVDEASGQAKLREKLKNFLGAIRRILTDRR